MQALYNGQITLARVCRYLFVIHSNGSAATIDSVDTLGAGPAQTNVDVRRASVGDAHGLARLKVEWGQSDPSPAVEQMDEFAGVLARWITRQGDSLVVNVAVADGDVVGMAWMVVFERVPDFDDRRGWTADIQSVYVTPSLRGRGLGSRLVDALCTAADMRGIPRTLVTASARSVPLYNRFGFDNSPLLLQRPAGRESSAR